MFKEINKIEYPVFDLDNPDTRFKPSRNWVIFIRYSNNRVSGFSDLGRPKIQF